MASDTDARPAGSYLAGSAVMLDFGIKLADGPPREVLRDPTVVEAYVGGRVPTPAQGA